MISFELHSLRIPLLLPLRPACGLLFGARGRGIRLLGGLLSGEVGLVSSWDVVAVADPDAAASDPGWETQSSERESSQACPIVVGLDEMCCEV